MNPYSHYQILQPKRVAEVEETLLLVLPFVFLFLLQPHPIYPAMPCIPKEYLRENNYSKVPSAKPFRGGILGVISRPGQEGEYTQCDTVKQRKRGSEICRSNMRGRGRMQTQIEIKYMIISQYVKILNHYVVYLKLT